MAKKNEPAVNPAPPAAEAKPLVIPATVTACGDFGKDAAIAASMKLDTQTRLDFILAAGMKYILYHSTASRLFKAKGERETLEHSALKARAAAITDWADGLSVEVTARPERADKADIKAAEAQWAALSNDQRAALMTAHNWLTENEALQGIAKHLAAERAASFAKLLAPKAA